MALYELKEDGGVSNTVTNQSIPNSLDNQQWLEYQAWLVAGNTPDPVPAAPVIDIDAEYDALSDWMKEIIGPGIAAFKARVAARRP